ncbi:hypothetical protein RYZ26_03245 [Terasakiella sp. A23]|uniref:hypothetical protein n=1 Tax=Terasakiella sp. FCG-A23 TaxID=3080561 RepID=UPI0029557E09|nr:hypothetical protein [Terasakiella sp. A23]MDV7338597.1 hypothetical protein [Terasakiella sp. A23]
MNSQWYSFFSWFIYGSGGKRGVSRVVQGWIVLEVYLGIVISLFLNSSPSTVSEKVSIPLSIFLMTIVISLVGAVQNVLVSKEIFRLSEFKDGGVADYVFPFHLSILGISITFVYWLVSFLKFFDGLKFSFRFFDFHAGTMFGILLLLISLRLSWGCLQGTFWMYFSMHQIRMMDNEE